MRTLPFISSLGLLAFLSGRSASSSNDGSSIATALPFTFESASLKPEPLTAERFFEAVQRRAQEARCRHLPRGAPRRLLDATAAGGCIAAGPAAVDGEEAAVWAAPVKIRGLAAHVGQFA